jgi:hypothetical protein
VVLLYEHGQGCEFASYLDVPDHPSHVLGSRSGNLSVLHIIQSLLVNKADGLPWLMSYLL